MSLTSWILDPFRKRPRKGSPQWQQSPRRNDDVTLYLRRLEDRRVLTVVGIADAYFVEDSGGSYFVGNQLGVLGNDSDTQGGTVQAQAGPLTTDQGGTVTLNPDGSFGYTSNSSPGEVYVDSFQYIATNTGGDESSPVTVTLYGGEIPIAFDQPTLLPVFGVESETPNDFVHVDLTSSAGGSLFLEEMPGITFDFGENGSGDIGISGTADDVNRALDTLEYTPPPGFSGYDDLYFAVSSFPGGELPPPPGGQPPGGQPPGGQPPGGQPPGGQSPGGQSPPPEFFFQDVPLYVEPPPGGTIGPGPGSGNVITVDDAYYVDPAQEMFSTSQQAGVLSNDFTQEEAFLYAESDTITTDLGGTVDLFSDGGFIYTPPDLPQDTFVDSFVYFASDEAEHVPGFVTLYVGAVPVPEDVNVPLPLFSVESPSPSSDFATVELSSSTGSSLLLLNTQGVVFVAGNNGDSSWTISGSVRDLNLALDSLDYLPPLDFSGEDSITFQYEIMEARGGTNPVTQIVPIDVFAVADPPGLAISPQPVGYLPGVFTPVDIDVALVDLDGSEIPGFVILEFVPAGVLPSVGQQSPVDPQTYFVLPSDLDNLEFFIDFGAPGSFTIHVLATSIETTDEPGVFGGPGGPWLPDQPFEPRFAVSGQALNFFRLPPPDMPPPPPNMPPPRSPGMMFKPPPPGRFSSPVVPTQVVFLLGPLSAPTNAFSPPKLTEKTEARNHQAPPPDAPKLVASVIDSSDASDSGETTTSVRFSSREGRGSSKDVVVVEEQGNEQTRQSFGSSGIYVRKLGSDGLGQTAQLPEELAEDYSRFMAFLKTLPNGDYVVYFKRSGQSHEQAVHRQLVVKVRVVNHRLNPDPGEFKPAGEVAEPPQNPNARNIPATTENPGENERAEIPAEVFQTRPPLATKEESAVSLLADDWTPLAAGAWIAALAGWKLQRQAEEKTTHIDRVMERFSQKPARRFRRRLIKNPS